LNNLAKIIATFFGAGYGPIAPGTIGAIFAFIISYFITLLYPSSFVLIHILMIFVFYVLGVWATNEVSKEWGSDPSKVVVDEAVGFWVAIVYFGPSLFHLCLGLLLFRIFDIWKPLGIRKIDEISHSGHAVMLDDVAAGLLSGIVTLILLQILFI
jgi:phosphatidylglycerophosphatase A